MRFRLGITEIALEALRRGWINDLLFPATRARRSREGARRGTIRGRQTGHYRSVRVTSSRGAVRTGHQGARQTVTIGTTPAACTVFIPASVLAGTGCSEELFSSRSRRHDRR